MSAATGTGVADKASETSEVLSRAEAGEGRPMLPVADGMRPDVSSSVVNAFSSDFLSAMEASMAFAERWLRISLMIKKKSSFRQPMNT